PPAPDVAERVRAHVGTLGTPTAFAFVGETDLTRASERVLAALGHPVPERWPAWHPAAPAVLRPGGLRGLFAGGTLRDEAAATARRTSYATRARRCSRPMPRRPGTRWDWWAHEPHGCAARGDGGRRPVRHGAGEPGRPAHPGRLAAPAGRRDGRARACPRRP